MEKRMWSSPYQYPSVDKPITISRSLPSIQWTYAQRPCCFRRRSGNFRLADEELTLEMGKRGVMERAMPHSGNSSL